MSFWDRFESTRDGIEDTIEFTIRMAVVTLAAVILVVVIAMVAGMFVSNEIVSSEKVFEIIGPAFNTIVGAFVGLLGGLSLNANARDKPADPAPEAAPEPAAPVTDDDDDMAPWEKYRNDLRYDANGDGVVDESDFPDWRNPGA
jgi:hypothetical protein